MSKMNPVEEFFDTLPPDWTTITVEGAPGEKIDPRVLAARGQVGVEVGDNAVCFEVSERAQPHPQPDVTAIREMVNEWAASNPNIQLSVY